MAKPRARERLALWLAEVSPTEVYVPQELVGALELAQTMRIAGGIRADAGLEVDIAGLEAEVEACAEAVAADSIPCRWHNLGDQQHSDLQALAVIRREQWMSDPAKREAIERKFVSQFASQPDEQVVACYLELVGRGARYLDPRQFTTPRAVLNLCIDRLRAEQEYAEEYCEPVTREVFKGLLLAMQRDADTVDYQDFLDGFPVFLTAQDHHELAEVAAEEDPATMKRVAAERNAINQRHLTAEMEKRQEEVAELTAEFTARGREELLKAMREYALDNQGSSVEKDHYAKLMIHAMTETPVETEDEATGTAIPEAEWRWEPLFRTLDEVDRLVRQRPECYRWLCERVGAQLPEPLLAVAVQRSPFRPNLVTS